MRDTTLVVKDDLLAGRPITKVGGVTVRELCNQFLASKQKKVDSGELAQRSWNDYYEACGKIIKVFGKGAKVANLRPIDFEALKKKYISLANRVTRLLYKAILLDISANEFAPIKTCLAILCDKIRTFNEQADIDDIMTQVDELLDKSIATKGYVIAPSQYQE